MKRILLTGCGSKTGKFLAQEYINAGWEVHAIGSTPVEGATNYTKDWDALRPEDVERYSYQLPELDAIWFNHNRPSPPTAKNIQSGILTQYDMNQWNKAIWVNNQFPILLIGLLKDRLSDNSTIGWAMGWGDINRDIDSPSWDCLGYGFEKVNNLMIMKAMARNHHSICYMIEPGHIEDRKLSANQIFEAQMRLSPSDNGNIIKGYSVSA